MHTRYLPLHAIVALTATVLACQDGDVATTTPEGQPAAASQAEEVTRLEQQLNQPFALEAGFRVIILSVSIRDQTGDPAMDVYQSHPAPGNVFVVVEYDLANLGTEAQGPPGFPVLRDAEGNEHEPATRPTSNYMTFQLFPGQEPPDREVPSGAQLRLAKVYEVAQAAWEAGGFQVVWEVDPWQGGERTTNYIRVN